MASTPQDVVDAVRSVVGDATDVPLHAPSIGYLEKKFVSECLDSTFVSSVGAFVDRFEREVASYTGAARGIAVANGTVALQVALLLAGVRPGDQVLIPALSFVATANAVVHAGAHPHFVDSEADTLGMDPRAVNKVLERAERRTDGLVDRTSGRRIAAIVPMHTLGHPTRIRELLEVAESHGIPVVEDAAESLGSFVGDQHTGTFGRLAALSFNGNKIVTTGGGGMILTNDEALAARAKHLTTTAKIPHAWEFEHDQVGFNFRLPNINAALGVAQVERLDQFRRDKRVIAERYRRVFSNVPGVAFVDEPAGTSSNFWLCAIRIDGGLSERDAVLEAANSAGLQARPLWNLLNRQSPFRAAQSEPTPVAVALHASVICLPSSPALVSA